MAVPSLPDLVSVGGRILAGTFNSQIRPCLSWLMKDAPLAQAMASSAQTIGYGSWTAIQLPTSVIDTAGLLGATPATPTRMYIGRSLGWYTVQGAVVLSNSSAGRQAARIALNGTAVPGSYGQGTGTSPAMAITPLVLVQATDPADYIELQTLVVDASTDVTVVDTQRASSLTATYTRTN